MIRLRAVIVFAAVVAATATAQPQPEPKTKANPFKTDGDRQPGGGGFQPAAAPVPTPLVAALLPFIGDEALTAELKLTPEQVKKLTGYRQQVWDEAYETAPAELSKKTEARGKATAAEFKAVLTPAQLERARLLAAREVIRTGRNPFAQPGAQSTLISGRTFATYPELADVLQLTDDQKAALTPKISPATGRMTFPSVAINADQTAVVDKALGPVPPRGFVASTDPRVNVRRVSTPVELRLLAVRDVQAELKTTPEQSNAVADLSRQWSTRTNASNALSPKENDARSAALAAATERELATLLKPEQAIRLRQIKIQLAAVGQPPLAIYRLPDVEKPLALTEQQKKNLDAVAVIWEADVSKAFETGATFEGTKKAVDAANAARDANALAVLTPDQAAKFKGLVGPPYTGRFADGFDPRGPGVGPGSPGQGPVGPGGPGFGATRSRQEASFGKYVIELSHLSRSRDIQDELKLTPEQVQKATQANADMEAKVRDIGPGTDPTRAVKYYAARSEIVEKAIADILTADQQKRFRQIMLQIAERNDGGLGPARLPAAVAYPGVAEAIKLTPEQKTKLLDGAKSADVLTDDQKTAIKGMLGEPYKGASSSSGLTPKINPNPNPNPNPFPQPNPNVRPKAFPERQQATFGIHLTDLSHIAGNPDVQTDLKMAPEQIQKAQAVIDPLSGPADLRNTDVAALTKVYADRSAAFEKAIAEILTPDQRKRLRQIMIQIMETPGGPTAFQIPSAVAYPGVAEAVKLTAEQKSKLFDGANPADVLTADQKAAIKGMLGEPYKGRVTSTGIGPTTRPDTGRLPAFPRQTQALAMGTYDEPLKITPEQKTKLTAAANDFRAATQQVFNSPDRTKELAAAVEKFEKDAVAVLTPDQQKWYAQLQVQTEAGANLYTALTKPETATKLGLTPEQTKQLETVAADSDKIADLLVAQNLPARKESELAGKVRDRADDRLLAVLTDAQRATWKDMTGEPWSGIRKSPLRQRGGFPLGGGGGFGGGFGGPGGGIIDPMPDR